METLDFAVEQGIGWIRLNRPSKHNALDEQLRLDLLETLSTVRANASIRVVVLTGGAGTFCAGGNLSALKEQAGAGPAYWHQRMNSGLRLSNELLNLCCPVIAAVDGPAIGAGFSLALCADMIIAGPRARFAMTHLRLGIVPDLGALYLLPRAVGLQRAKELAFSTRELRPEEAKELGIVMEVHSEHDLEARVHKIAQSLTQASPTALALTKSMLNCSLDSDRQTMFNLEASGQAAAFSAPEPPMQIEALLSRKEPAFSGFPPRF